MISKKLYFIALRLRNSSCKEILYRLRESFFVFSFSQCSFLYKNVPTEIQPALNLLKAAYFPNINGSVAPHQLQFLREKHCFCLHEMPEQVAEYENENRHTHFSKVALHQKGPDIRGVWEKGRLQNVSLLLQEIENSSQSKDKRENTVLAQSLLKSWLQDNPFGYGPHYISVMECGLRIPLFIRTIKVIDIWQAEEVKQLAIAIYQHGWLIRKRLSLYSSLGNHTVAECVGLVFAGFFFRDQRNGREWLKKGIELLEQECFHQILPDGGPVEQSFSYHRFVLDLYWLAIDFLEQNKLHDCTSIKERVRAGDQFLRSMHHNTEQTLRIGDGDDGQAIGPGLSPAICHDVPIPGNCPVIRSYPETGYTLIRTAGGGRLVFDHGPLGMAPLYNHGHADALSVWVSIESADFIIDTGTFQYNGDQKLRRYFKGTRAHNTVTIDNCDQAEQLTSFIWGKPYSVSCSQQQTPSGRQYITAAHDGYSQLKEPVIHKRNVLNVAEEIFSIHDSFEGSGIHSFELNFHLHPDVILEQDDGELLLHNKEASLGMALIGDQFTVIKGAKDPLCGWYSPKYGVLEKTNTLQARREGNPSDITFHTIIKTGGALSKKELEQTLLSCDIPY